MFTNIYELRSELETYRSRPHLRLGTGELADSLALDPDTGLSRRILEIFRDFPRMVFEFKTKSIEVGQLLEVSRVPKNVVVSWSLNPDPVCRWEEHGAPGLSARLDALAAVAEKGYRVGVHFDPMIAVPRWREWYPALVEEIMSRIQENSLAWWSLGTLRFPPALRDIILSRPESRLFSGELVRGYDGKFRYFRPLRQEMFTVTVQAIRALVSPAVPVYLCMEDHDMWRRVLPGVPAVEEEINQALHFAALR